MQIVKNVILNKEENDIIGTVIMLLAEYEDAKIDIKYKPKQDMARKAREALAEFWLSAE